MAKGKSAVAELEDDDLELVEDEDDAPAKPAKGKSKGKAAPAPKAEKAESTGMGASWLAEYVNEELGTEYTAANMRVILRKMAADGEMDREVGTDRARYQFTGERDPIVRAVLKRVRSGEADQAKAERLAAAKSGKKAKVEELEEDEAPVKKPAKRAKAKVAEAEEEAPTKAPVRRKRSAE